MEKKLRAKAPKNSPFRLEVAETYENRDGDLQVKIIVNDFGNPAGPFEKKGVFLKRPKWAGGFAPYWHKNGMYHPADHVPREPRMDLVKLAPGQRRGGK